MNIHTLCPMAIIGALFLLPLSLEAQNKGKNSSSKNIDQEDSSPVAAGPNQHLMQARTLFDQGKLEESSTAIFKAIDNIHKRMLSSESLPTEGAINATNRLDALANKISKGKIRNVKILDQQFAKVSEEMATYYGDLARVAAGEQNPRLTRSALGRVANYLENVSAWTGQKLSKENKANISEMRKLGQDPNQGGKTLSAETKDLIKKSPVILETLKKTSRPAKR